MSEKESNGTVHNEQFGNSETTDDSNENKVLDDSAEKPVIEPEEEKPEQSAEAPPSLEIEQHLPTDKKPGIPEPDAGVTESSDAENETADQVVASDPSPDTTDPDHPEPAGKQSENTVTSTKPIPPGVDSKPENPEDEKTGTSTNAERDVDDTEGEDKKVQEKRVRAKKEKPAKIEPDNTGIVKHGSERTDHAEHEVIDYSRLSRGDLVKVLKELLDKQQMDEIRKDVEVIKSSFYKSLKADKDAIKKQFLEEGGLEQDFKLEEQPEEKELKELLNKYRDLRSELARKYEEQKDTNLKEKYEIIESIKELVNSQESLNKTFHEFRELQNRWREIGPVPQSAVKDLWESYHYQVEAFYDYIKINKELRDLDLKKNFEAKLKLCETAEELLLEPSVVEAFRLLQKLHDQWRELGPVPIEKRTEIWERFKDTTTKINRKHQEYFVNLKQEQKKNYEEKQLLCAKAEELAALDLENHKDWEVKSRELIELQKVWKTIGFAPKKYNNPIYDRFRKACDTFFNKKREYYSHNREDQHNNLQMKTELCIHAEALQNSTDWKKTTDEFIALQKKWKEIGPVPLKQSDKIWKRFRASCDVFFNNKSKFFSQIDTRYEENLELKNTLIAEIENFEPGDDVEKNLNSLKEFQRRWSEIGFVPIKHKDEIQERYRKVINSKFDQLKLDENKKSIIKFRDRVEGIQHKPNAQYRIRNERDKCFNKLKQLESDITVWENNIGFFANSDGAESMINDVQNKIDSARKKIELLKNKINLLDEFD
jgi:hypothetical protein